MRMRALIASRPGGPEVLVPEQRPVPRPGPVTIVHQGQLPAVTIGFNTAPGVSLGEA